MITLSEWTFFIDDPLHIFISLGHTSTLITITILTLLKIIMMIVLLIVILLLLFIFVNNITIFYYHRAIKINVFYL